MEIESKKKTYSKRRKSNKRNRKVAVIVTEIMV